MILIDSNIPMYLLGADRVHKANAQRILTDAVARSERLVTDVEVLQEILHRHAAGDRREAIQPTFDVLLGVVDEVIAVELADLMRAKDIVLGNRRLSARDALHVAVMERAGIDTIASFDRGFDTQPGIRRIG